MKLDSTQTIEQIKKETLKLLNSEDENLVANINEEYLAADFLVPDTTSEREITTIKYYGWDMAYSRGADRRMYYTFLSTSMAGSIGSSPSMACGTTRCSLPFDDYDHNSTNAMCGYYSVVEFVYKH